MLTRFALLASVLLLAGCGSGFLGSAPLPPELKKCVVSSFGSRSVVTHVPTGHALPMSVVVALHGLDGSPADMESTTGFDARGDRDGAIVVYPTASNGQWNQAPAVLGSEPDDVGYLSGLVQSLVANGCANPGRLYVTGISNGAGMAYRLACDGSLSVAALGTVSGDYLGGDRCSRTRAVPAIAMHGTADHRVPLAGVTNGTSVHPPVEQWASGWAGRNGCAPNDPAVTNDLVPAARVLRWGDCPAGADVVLYELDGGGHEWFGSASDRVWAFFRDHGLGAAVS